MTGNTKKLAEALAMRLQLECHDISSPLDGKTDILFFGSSLYKNTFDPAVGEFLKSNREKISCVVFFGSSASGRTAQKKLVPYCESLGIKVYSEYFNCLGHFLFLHKKKPDEDDIENLYSFALKASEELGKDQ